MRNRTRMARIAIEGMGVLLCAARVSALPILSEVYYDAPGSDDGQSFVELAGTPGDSLEGLVIEGVNGANGEAGPSIVLMGSIGPDGLFVLADQTSSGATSVIGADQLANFDFQNGPDSIVLRRDGDVLDAVGYGVFDSGEIFAGEGAAAPDGPAGTSLARFFANLDTGDNAIDFAVNESPSPGVAAFAPVPEPGTALLFGLGLAGLARAGDGRRGEARPRMEA